MQAGSLAAARRAVGGERGASPGDAPGMLSDRSRKGSRRSETLLQWWHVTRLSSVPPKTRQIGSSAVRSVLSDPPVPPTPGLVPVSESARPTEGRFAAHRPSTEARSLSCGASAFSSGEGVLAASAAVAVIASCSCLRFALHGRQMQPARCCTGPHRDTIQ